MAPFLILFFAIFFYAAYVHGAKISDFRPSPELFGALLVTLSIFMIEYSRVSAASTGGLAHTPAIVLEVGFLSTMLGILLSILGQTGVAIVVLLLAALLSMIFVLYFITDIIWKSKPGGTNV